MVARIVLWRAMLDSDAAAYVGITKTIFAHTTEEYMVLHGTYRDVLLKAEVIYLCKHSQWVANQWVRVECIKFVFLMWCVYHSGRYIYNVYKTKWEKTLCIYVF